MITLVTGGCRSGKSRYALDMADQLDGKKIFCATCPRQEDREMRARITRHQAERVALSGWQTVEESLDLIRVIHQHQHETILIDCLTLWVSNLMYQASQLEKEFTEDDIAKLTLELVDVLKERETHAILVTNETGMGIVPENKLARQYRDIIGRCNQIIGHHSDRLILMVSGQPVNVKGN